MPRIVELEILDAPHLVLPHICGNDGILGNQTGSAFPGRGKDDLTHPALMFDEEFDGIISPDVFRGGFGQTEKPFRVNMLAHEAGIDPFGIKLSAGVDQAGYRGQFRYARVKFFFKIFRNCHGCSLLTGLSGRGQYISVTNTAFSACARRWIRHSTGVFQERSSPPSLTANSSISGVRRGSKRIVRPPASAIEHRLFFEHGV